MGTIRDGPAFDGDAVRSVPDRIRQAVAFEVIGLVLVAALGAPLLGLHPGDLGAVALLASLLATVWNYVYNVGFDRLLARRGARKTPLVRVVHAVLFEAGLLVATLPLIAWWLEVGVLTALAMDVALAAFYVVYTFVFTWAYDRLFPVDAATGSCGCP